MRAVLFTSLVVLAGGLGLAQPATATDAPGELVQEFKRARSDMRRRALALQIEALGNKAEPALLGSWRSATEETGVQLIGMIRELKGEAPRRDLLKAARSRKAGIRRAVAFGLSSFAHPDSTKCLLRLARDRNEGVSIASLESLEVMADPKAFERLLWLTTRLVDREGSPARIAKLRVAIATNLNRNPEPEALILLCRAAANYEGPSQEAILGVFELIRCKQALPFMLAALEEYLDPNEFDESLLEQALRDSTTADMLRPVSAAFAKAVVTGLGRARHQEAAPALLKALSTKDPSIRLATLQVIHLVLPKGPRSPGKFAPEDFPELRRRAFVAVMSRLTDSSKRIRDRACAWLRRETGERRISLSYPAWKSWFDTYFETEDEYYEEEE